MKNIVVLTRRYYPNMSPISAVIDKYIQKLKSKYHFHIICIAGHSALEKPKNEDVSIYYIKNKLWLFRLWSEEKFNDTGKIFYYLLMQVCRARAAFLNLFGDNLAYKWEKKEYYAELKRISNNTKIDGIISVSGDTMFTHLAAERFKLDNPNTIWITYFTDPYTFQNMMYYPSFFNKEMNKKKRYKIEKGIYDNANYNIVTEELLKSVLVEFKQSLNNTICFKYVLENIRETVCLNLPKLPNDTIKMMYAGAFYKNIRNPQPVMEIMKNIENVIFDLYVTSQECDDILKKYKSEYIRIYNAIPSDEYKHKICYEYDILVNVGNDCDLQAPSKMLEYLSTGRPIINFFYRMDSQYDLISRYPLGLNIDVHNKDAHAQIMAFCKKMKGKQLPYKYIEELYPNNCLLKQVSELDLIFESK